jgi:transposase
MRGMDHQQSHMFSYLSPESRVRKDHPLRAIRTMVDEVLRALSPQFGRMYAREGRPSIAPEKLLRAQLLQMLYSIRSERLLMEEIDYSMLFRLFVGLNLDEEVWDATSFTKNRDRLLEAEVAKQFLAQVVEQARAQSLTSDEHSTVDGTLLEAWAGAKSFQRKDGKNPPPGDDDAGNPTVNFHGEKRSNRTHASTTDPEAQMARKGWPVSICGDLRTASETKGCDARADRCQASLDRPGEKPQSLARLVNSNCCMLRRAWGARQYCRTIPPACTELTVYLGGKVQSSVMAKKMTKNESARATLREVKIEMAKPRVAKSARSAEPQESRVFPLSGSAWPGLGTPVRRFPKVATHPGAL